VGVEWYLSGIITAGFVNILRAVLL